MPCSTKGCVFPDEKDGLCAQHLQFAAQATSYGIGQRTDLATTKQPSGVKVSEIWRDCRARIDIAGDQESVVIPIPDGYTADKFQNNLRSMLTVWKETQYIKWSICKSADGLLVRKVGHWPAPLVPKETTKKQPIQPPPASPDPFIRTIKRETQQSVTHTQTVSESVTIEPSPEPAAPIVDSPSAPVPEKALPEKPRSPSKEPIRFRDFKPQEELVKLVVELWGSGSEETDSTADDKWEDKYERLESLARAVKIHQIALERAEICVLNLVETKFNLDDELISGFEQVFYDAMVQDLEEGDRRVEAARDKWKKAS